MKNLLLILSFLFFHNFSAQKTENFKIKQYTVATLPDSLKESSGLNFFNGKLYTFNDSGNSGELFQIDPKSANIQKKLDTRIRNIDWEALTNDGDNFYIGDFGNNGGSRKDLKIYKIPFSDSLKMNSLQNITFNYPAQTDFSFNNLNTDFDAEAMIFLNGKIHLFTKEWKSKATTHYTIDPGNFELQGAKKIETEDLGFVVTDASYFNEKLYLVGYTKGTKVYLQIFERSDSDLFFSQLSKKYYLGSALSLSQIEGIAVNEDGIYISGENFTTPLGTKKGKFYFIPNTEFN